MDFVTYRLFWSVLFSKYLQILLDILLLLSSNLICCVQKIYLMISLILFLDTCFMAQYMNFFLMNISLVLEKNMYSVVIVHIVLELLIAWNWLLLFKSCRYSLIFCLVVLSVTKRVMLKSPMKILNVSFFDSADFLVMYFEALLLVAYTISLWWIDHFIIMKYFCLSFILFLALKSILCDINTTT